MLPERNWDAMLVDHALGAEAATRSLARPRDVPRRIVLVTPAERHELATLKAAGFTGYLVKPVRAASLAARFGERSVRAGACDVAEHAPRDGAIGKGLSILIAEDNEINALLARSLLAKLGHRPTVAANGAAAVDAWRRLATAARPTTSC